MESEGLHDILETAQHGSSTDERQKSAIHSLYLHLILNHFLIETIQINLMFAYKSRKMHFLSVSVSLKGERAYHLDVNILKILTHSVVF